MNAATEFDVGPLTWVKSEIDLALERADQALNQYTTSVTTGAGDLTQIKFCRTYLHQVQGALTIVGLDGVKQLAEALEALLEAVEKMLKPAGESTVDLSHRCLQAIGRYLDDLVSGHPNQPLRLLALYEEVQHLRGIERVTASDLFFPDLNVRPPRRETLAPKMSRGEFQKLLRQERGRFQKGLLTWLRNPQDRGGISEMLRAVRHIEATQDAASARSFWWVAIGLLTALSEGALPPETNVKQLCARIDLQIRRLFEGSKNVAERLMRDALFFVAQSESRSETVELVKQTYHLADMLPTAEVSPSAPEEALRRRLRDTIAAAEEAWNKFCTGTVQSLPVFREHVAAIATIVEKLGHTDYRRLAQAITAAATWLGEDSSRHSDILSMEMATGLLLAQNAQENFQRLGSDFAHQVDVTVARIHGCIAGLAPQADAEVPLLDEMSRKAQEKLLISQVAKEIQSNLGQIEQVLDGFFRDVTKRGDLASLESPLHQIGGALTIMREDGAVAALRTCTEEIKRFAAADYIPVESDFEHVANELSLIGFFIDAMQHAPVDFETFVRQMQRSEPPVADAIEDEEEAAESSVEQEVEQQKREAQTLLDALKEQPDDAGLREELRQNLTALKSDADLVADATLGEQTKAMLTALDAGTEVTPQIEQVMASFKPESDAALQPSAETLQLSQASNEEIDAELLGIFLEEAHEVLATIEENLETLRNQPHNVEVLTTIRRSFHTLKGSGRMVGLKDVGEAAWAIEQTLNLWLRQEQEVTFALFNLLDQAKTVFRDWVRHLETRTGTAPDPAAMIAFADSLRQGEGEAPTLPAMAPSMTETIVTRFIGHEYDEPEPTPELPSAEIISLDFPVLPGDASETVSAESGGAEIIEFGAAETAPTEAFSLPNSDETKAEAEIIAFAPLEELPEILVETPAETPVDVDATESAVAEFVAESVEAPMAWPPAIETAPESLATETTGTDVAGEAGTPGEEPVALPVEEPTTRSGPSGVLLDIFRDEANGHLGTLQRQLAVLEREEVVPTPHEMYRAAHTLAGISATVGIPLLNQLGHALENALMRRDHAAQPGSLEALGVIRMAIDEIGLVLASLADRRDIALPPGLIENLDEIYPAQIIHPSIEAAETVVEEPAVAEEFSSLATPAIVASATKPEAPRLSTLIAALPHLQDEIDEQLLPIFLEEAQDLTRGIASQLESWRKDPGDTAAVAALTRLLHTLKGSARMAGAMNLGEITHAIETRIADTERAGTTSSDIVEDIINVFDDVQHIIERLQSGETLEPAAVEHGTATPAPLPEAAPAAFEPAEQSPAHPERRATRQRFTEAAESGDVAAQRATLRVRADLIDHLVNEAGELSIARTRIEGEMRSLKDSLLDLTENVIRLRRQLRDIEIQAETQMQSREAQSDTQHAGFDPLEFDRFTRFQEITRMMAESVNDVGTVQQNLLKNLDDANAAILAQARLNRVLQHELMTVRMVPFGSLADRLYRIMRQTSKELDKRVNLEIVGGQVELDRSVLDKMGAPLEHMLRNAIAHGLESREVRLAAGKPEAGEVAIALRQEGNEVILSFADDGAGLNFPRIRERAIAAGLLGEHETISDEHLAEMIFMPGFSTAAEISQISGRGVGMDVVKSEVTSLGGRIEITSQDGKGTEFRLFIPLTLAVTKALLVRSGARHYAVPSVMIEQVLDLKADALERIRAAGSAEWLGHHYPFSFLPHLLGEPDALPEQRRQYWVLLLRSGARRIAVLVDELMGNREIVVKNIGPQLARVIGIDGATVLGDGEVVLILNPIALSTRAPVVNYEPMSGATEPVAEEPPAVHLPTVMVVDDSLTVRKITSRLLAREGYQVLIAKDGVEALEQLIDVIPDVMLVDIEMPRLDGFDLTRNIRADQRLKGIPIIMITSRTAEKHRNYAFEIGVNHFLGKPFQEEELLHLVAQHISAEPAL